MPIVSPEGREYQDSEIVSIIKEYEKESRAAKKERTYQNSLNWDTYHLKGDFSQKREGQSKEFLPKLFVAVEQATGIIKKALINFDQWMELDEFGPKDEIFDMNTIAMVDRFYMERADIRTKITDCMKNGFMEALATAKVHGGYKKRAYYEATSKENPDEKEFREFALNPKDRKPLKKQLKKHIKKVWQLIIDVVDAVNYFPDVKGRGLYEIQTCEKDLFEIVKLSTGPDAIYDKSVVDQISSSYVEDEDKRSERAKDGLERDDYVTRKMVKLTEFYGTILDQTGKIIKENCIATIANDLFLIRKPEDNPFWHEESPFISAPLVRVSGSVWHKAIGDAPAFLNNTLNDIFNLMVDGGMNAAMNACEVNPDWLKNPGQVSNGVRPGDTILTSSRKPPGEQAIRPVQVGKVPNDALQMYNLIDSEFQASAFTNDIRMGQQPGKTTTATAIASADSAVTGLFDYLAKDIEDVFMEPLFEKCHLVIWQNMEEIDDEELIALLGEEKVAQINSIPKEERFARVTNRAKFRCKGLSAVLNRFRDVARFQNLLQVIASNPDLMNEFKKKYSFQKLLAEFVMAIGIDEGKLALTEEEKQTNKAEEQAKQAQIMQMQALEAQAKQKPGPKPMANEQMLPEQNPEEFGGGAMQVNAAMSGLR